MLRLVRLVIVTFFHTLWRRLRHGRARPTWSFAFEAMVRYLRRDWNETQTWELPRLRDDLNARPYPSSVMKQLTLRDEDLGGVATRWFVPPGASDDVVILYLHGGSFLYGSVRTTHADVVARIALASGISTAGIEYRLAPEHPYPAQLDDALSAFEALVASGRQVLVSGDSAGGNLAVALAIHLRDHDKTAPLCLALISPWCDLEMPGRSFVDNDPFDFGTREELVHHARMFARDLALSDPRISPSRADLSNLPPAIVIAGEAEIPRDDILAFADALEAAGSEVTRYVATDMPHDPPVFAAYHPAAEECMRALGEFLSVRAPARARVSSSRSQRPHP
jgi:epsilon-lactone hydrolase